MSREFTIRPADPRDAPGSRMTTFSRARIAITVKCGDATAMAANRMARIIQNLTATRLFVMAATAENFMRVCPQPQAAILSAP